MSFTIDFSNIYRFLMSNMLIKTAIYFLGFVFISFVIYKIVLTSFLYFKVIDKNLYKDRTYRRSLLLFSGGFYFIFIFIVKHIWS